MFHSKQRKRFQLILSCSLLFCFLLQISCSGNECAATQDYVDDSDSDCVDDTADNCPGVYNPTQLDSNEDNIGDACSAALILAPDRTVPSETIFLKRLSILDMDDEYEIESVKNHKTLLLNHHNCKTQPFEEDGVSKTNHEGPWWHPQKQNNLDCVVLSNDSNTQVYCKDSKQDCLVIYDLD